MTFQQLVAPNLGTTDGAGWCHRFARNVFGAPMGYNSAWEAWQATEYKHPTSEPLPSGAAVLLWFSHYGTYGSPPTYGNWGHVAIHVPGIGIYTSPGYGYGQEVWTTIGQIESRFASKYVGWSEDINGLRVAAPSTSTPDGQEEEDEEMAQRHAVFHTQGGVQTVIIGEPSTGWKFKYTTSETKGRNPENEKWASVFETGDFVNVSDRSMLDAWERSLDEKRQGK